MSNPLPSAFCAGRFAAADRVGTLIAPPPVTTALGALLGHITVGADAATYQPMNVNFGLFPPVTGKKKADRKQMYTGRAKADLVEWIRHPSSSLRGEASWGGGPSAQQMVEG
jgi:methylenetetrahydrofolate--tRNA-(uracil-5-)-methyltransferase